VLPQAPCSGHVSSGAGAAGASLSVSAKRPVSASVPYVQRTATSTGPNAGYSTTTGVPAASGRNPPPASSSTASGTGNPGLVTWKSSDQRNGTLRPR
jgi:hypothetical protein